MFKKNSDTRFLGIKRLYQLKLENNLVNLNNDICDTYYIVKNNDNSEVYSESSEYTDKALLYDYRGVFITKKVAFVNDKKVNTPIFFEEIYKKDFYITDFCLKNVQEYHNKMFLELPFNFVCEIVGTGIRFQIYSKNLIEKYKNIKAFNLFCKTSGIKKVPVVVPNNIKLDFLKPFLKCNEYKKFKDVAFDFLNVNPGYHTSNNILITGESGSGKSFLTKYLASEYIKNIDVCEIFRFTGLNESFETDKFDSKEIALNDLNFDDESYKFLISLSKNKIKNINVANINLVNLHKLIDFTASSKKQKILIFEEEVKCDGIIFAKHTDINFNNAVIIRIKSNIDKYDKFINYDKFIITGMKNLKLLEDEQFNLLFKHSLFGIHDKSVEKIYDLDRLKSFLEDKSNLLFMGEGRYEPVIMN